MLCLVAGLQTSFTLLIIFHRFNPKLNKANQEGEKNLYTKLIFIWKMSFASADF